MDDLDIYEKQCGNFNMHLATYDEEVALFENNKELGTPLIRFQKYTDQKN